NYRFLYPVYPLVCVAASAVIESFPDLVKEKHNPNDNSVIVIIAKVLRPLVLSLILCASHARTFSLVNVRWIDDGFRGLLPLPFNSSLGGTSAAPPYFNNKNKASDLQYVMFLISSSSPLWICYFLYCN
ncbi:Dol-P-Man:Man(6)GlcNAc(2)-PP-Dol alpha-1,2-mannosyltransferase, partial [Linum perenne]